VAFRELRLVLSGGTELDLVAAIAGAGLDLAALAGGRLTALQLTWRKDGRLLRPAIGRGQLALSLAMPEGIGASRLVMLALAQDPPGAAALFAGAEARVAWHPGLRPRGATP